MQAALNVAKNAAQALSGTPVAAPEIRLVTRVARGVTLSKRHYRLALAIAVEDNGPGVPDDLSDRIFFPLVSGREGGTGLGPHDRADVHHAARRPIECESPPGRTVFTVLLPCDLSGRAVAWRANSAAHPRP